MISNLRGVAEGGDDVDGGDHGAALTKDLRRQQKTERNNELGVR